MSEKSEAPTPSMDDKATPSPPVRTNEQYDADKKAGVERIGQPQYREDFQP